VARWLTPESLEGGVALACGLRTAAGEVLVELPWLALPRPLDPGESLELEVALRRPPGPASLRIALVVIGGGSCAGPGGPVFERPLPAEAAG
jgi:hypothetical protein